MFSLKKEDIKKLNIKTKCFIIKNKRRKINNEPKEIRGIYYILFFYDLLLYKLLCFYLINDELQYGNSCVCMCVCVCNFVKKSHKVGAKHDRN